MAMQTVERWDVFEIELNGPSTGNPFTDVKLSGEFRLGHRAIAVEGFYDGGGTYRVRFSPDTVGEWQYVTRSDRPELAGKTGTFTCTPATAGNHGPVSVVDTYHFGHADGTRHVSVGTTCYAWIHQTPQLQELTIRTLAGAPFNKLRMCVFPKSFLYNRREPDNFAFVRNADRSFDPRRFDPAFWRNLEHRIGQLRDLSIEADLILFHPYDEGRWGFDRMDAQTDDFYLRYAVARLASFRNVWWSMANEWDLMKAKSMADWDRFFRVIQQHDPYQRLRSIHNAGQLYDHNKPWVHHASVQRHETFEAARLRDQYRRPVVYDEVCYEGNIQFLWGNITGQELVRRFWEASVRGAYCGHGETFAHPQDLLWWSHGGELHGESAPRIAWMRKILEEAPGPLTPLPDFFGWQWLYGTGTWNKDYYLCYFGIFRPSLQELQLPEDRRYTIEILDTWDMTSTSLPGTYSGAARFDMPGKQWMALRIKRA